MTFEQYRSAFQKAASDAGYSEGNIIRCLNYAKALFENNVPVIYNTSHLSSLVGYKKAYIKKAAFYIDSFYTEYTIEKKNGGTRIISEPLPSLKEIQIWVLENILQQLTVSPYAKAYRKNITIVENLKYHHKQPIVFTLDIENFFPSIRFYAIEKIFISLGYSALISNLLAKLCTKSNSLPQGAPTSPYLSNLFFLSADNLISDYCKQHAIRYTRYADDLTFSGDFDDRMLLEVVKASLSSLGLSINPRKTRMSRRSERQTVTGIVVNDKSQVVFHKRNRIRQELYYIKKFGLESHMLRTGIKQKRYVEHLLGKVNFILHINPGDGEFLAYREHLLRLMNGGK